MLLGEDDGKDFTRRSSHRDLVIALRRMVRFKLSSRRFRYIYGQSLYLGSTAVNCSH